MGNRNSKNEICFKESIGRGSYGEVFKGTWKGKDVALKKLESFFFEGSYFNRGPMFDKISQEWDMLSRLNHPNIVQYYTVILSDKEPPVIVLELCLCDLNSFIRKESNRKVPLTEAVNIMSDVAEGLKYLHGQPEPIIHRDLTSKNVLMTSKKRAKITDLGLSKVFPQGAMYATAGVGTQVYRAPETWPERLGKKGHFAQKAYYTEKIDIFSFGALLLEVVIGRLPEGPLPDPFLDDGEIVPEYVRRSKELHEMGVDHPLYPLVSRCLNNLPQDRPSAQELCDYLNSFKQEQIDIKFDKSSLSRPGTSLSSASGMTQINIPYAKKRLTKDRYDYSFKISVFGDAAVGKSSIIRRFLHPETDQFMPVTTLQHADFFERLLCHGKTVHLHIVDTPGERKSIYHQAQNVVRFIYRGLNGAVIVFDVGDKWTFNNIVGWIEAIHERCNRDIPIVLVGNKTDIEPSSWEVSSHNAEAFASKQGIFYIETSAIGLINIDEIFSILIAQMMQRCDIGEMKGEASVDWVLFQPNKGSLLKGDQPPPYSLISDRTTAQPLRSSNIHVEYAIEENDGGNRKSRCSKC